MENFVYVMVVIYLLYFVRLYWKSLNERRALSRFASAMLFDDDFHRGQRDGFHRELKSMPGKDAATLAMKASEAALGMALDFDKGAAPSDVHEALMATKAKADSS